jgi:hypothetical protein
MNASVAADPWGCGSRENRDSWHFHRLLRLGGERRGEETSRQGTDERTSVHKNPRMTADLGGTGRDGQRVESTTSRPAVGAAARDKPLTCCMYRASLWRQPSASEGSTFGVSLEQGGAVMKKILSLTLVAVLSLTLAAPVSAGGRGGGGGHGGFRGGVRGGFHGGFHHDGFGRFGCCFGPGFVGGVFVGSAFAYPYYGYPYYPYAYPYASYYPDPVYVPAPVYQQQTQVSVAPSIQREVCYPSGCYHLQGDGVTVAYSWVWVPAAPAGPPAPSAPPGR